MSGELYRVLIDVTDDPMFGGQWAKYEQRTHRYDVIVYAPDEGVARRLALATFAGRKRRRVVKESLVPIKFDGVSRVLMYDEVKW